MTMRFRTVKAALVTLLGNAEAGRYRTVGYQRQGDSTDENLDTLRSVRVYYSEGEFPESGGSIVGPTRHNCAFNLEFTVAKSAEMDLTVIDNPASTPAQLAAALVAASTAEHLADDSMDEFFDIIYQIIMDARNVDLGLAETVGGRWISRVRKGEALARGKHVTLSGLAQMTCNVAEDVLGDTGTAGGEFDLVTDLEGDDVEKTGVFVDNK
jgi:hypothetical protein